MANWATLQEDLTGLRVVKRAKHGIHFDKGGGQILANFSGRPCHFLDGGLWKPIDTKLLLLPDGFYGCPHSPVKVSKDGMVKVTGSDYQQFTELPSAKAGVLDGDRIVREFPGGRQYLYVTEDGFKQEIVLEKCPDLAKVSALLDTVSGVLPTKYVASALSAKDSTTAELADSVTLADAKALATYLEKAKYPVVIDPDFSTTSTAGDTLLRSDASTLNYGDSTSFGTSTVNILLRFDSSSISSEAEVSAASLKFIKANAVSSASEQTTVFYSVAQANEDWIEGTKDGATAGAGEPCWDAKEADGSGGVTTAWAGSAGCATSGTDYESTALGSVTWNRSDEQYTEHIINFNADGKTRIKGWFGAINTNYGLIATKNYRTNWYTSEIATEGYRPVLTVTYTVALTGSPHYYYAQH